MQSNRRDFLRQTAGLGSWVVLGGSSLARSSSRGEDAAPSRRLKVLILGGTGFIGPHQVKALLARGHQVTLFNRGKSRPDLFADLERLVGDRDPDKGDGLKALEGRRWDVVLDNSNYYPRMVRASAELLAPSVGQYIIVSSISCYAGTAEEGMTEAAALATMEDPTLEDMGPQYQYYGALKALCEQAAEKAMPGRVAVVRPGYIVGPGDSSHRFTYWPVRIEQGGEVAVPGDPDDPIQVIDARDLTDWMVHLAEQNTVGVFNACGPDERLSMRMVCETCRDVTGSDARFTWIDTAFLKNHPEARFPIWIPYEGETRGFHTVSNARAIAAGLTFRPLADTVSALLKWFEEELSDEARQSLLDRIPSPAEATVLEKWHEQQAKAKQGAGRDR